MQEATDKKIFAIGDVHGCNAELQLLLEQLPLDKDSTVVFLGDYVDRGNDSRGVIDTILNLKNRTNVVALKGNHEAMMLDFLEHPESSGAGMFIFNGGSATLSSYQTSQGHFEIPAEHLKFLKELALSYQTDRYFFVHAGVPNVPLESLTPDEHGDQMLWVRNSFLNSKFHWSKTIVHGHTPVGEPEILNFRINVDTGCVYDNRLTAIELPSQKIYSVQKQIKAEAQAFLRSSGTTNRVAERFRGAITLFVDIPGQGPLEFETLNYTPFGALIRQTAPPQSLAIHQEIEGTVGPAGPKAIRFKGEVVRTETRGNEVLYGIRIDSLDSPGDSL